MTVSENDGVWLCSRGLPGKHTVGKYLEVSVLESACPFQIRSIDGAQWEDSTWPTDHVHYVGLRDDESSTVNGYVGAIPLINLQRATDLLNACSRISIPMPMLRKSEDVVASGLSPTLGSSRAHRA